MRCLPKAPCVAITTSDPPMRAIWGTWVADMVGHRKGLRERIDEILFIDSMPVVYSFVGAMLIGWCGQPLCWLVGVGSAKVKRDDGTAADAEEETIYESMKHWTITSYILSLDRMMYSTNSPFNSIESKR